MPGLRDMEAALPLAGPTPMAVAPGLVVGKVGLVTSLPAGTPRELSSRVGVVGAVSVLPLPPTILVVEGVGKDVAGREWEVLALGSGVVPPCWFLVGPCLSLGALVAWVAAEAVFVAGTGLPVEDEVYPVSVVSCPGLRGLEVCRVACVPTLAASVAERLASVFPEAGDVL